MRWCSPEAGHAFPRVSATLTRCVGLRPQLVASNEIIQQSSAIGLFRLDDARARAGRDRSLPLRPDIPRMSRRFGSGDHARFEPHAASGHIERDRQTIGQRSFSLEADLLSSLTRIPDRDPHLSGARRTMIYNEFGPI